MIPFLIVAHGSLGDSLIECASFVLGRRPEHLESLNLSSDHDPERMLEEARARVAGLDRGEGVLILADIYGATPCRTICKLITPGRVEAVAGVNLPMLLKLLTSRADSLDGLIRKAVEGGQRGVMFVAPQEDDHCNA